ncbi:MAG: hypothetical protein ACO3P9_05015 [Phycisphaerales bacterium]
MGDSAESRPASRGSRFVILFPGRTGSSWLVSALDGHPRIDVRGEILVAQTPDAQRRLVEERLGNPPAPGESRGFKTKLKDVADLDALRVAIGTEVAVVHMVRRDLLRLAISTINARRLHRRTGRWNRADGVRALPPLDVEIDVLLATIDECATAVATLADYIGSLAAPVLEVDYAEVVHDPEGLLRRVQQHVGGAPRPLASGVLKNTGTDLREAVADFDRLTRDLAGSRWNRLLEDLDPAEEAPPSG